MKNFSLVVLNMFFIAFLFSSCSSNDNPIPESNKSYSMVTTLAGSDLPNTSSDGLGTQASFWNISDLVADSKGNLFVVEWAVSKIRKITSAGVVTTFASGNIVGSVDGTGVNTFLGYTLGITIDASDNLYVANTANNKILKITPAGMVTTVAGTGVAGSTDGNINQASFNGPSDVAIDISGNLYVVDSDNYKIRKITPTGIVSTFAGNGTEGSTDGKGVLASFSMLTNITIDTSNNLYVTDTFNNNTIRKITPTGEVTTLAGGNPPTFNSDGNGVGSNATFYTPKGITIDKSGNLYVAEYYGNKIRKITPLGVVTTFAGTGISGGLDGLLATATFNNPFGVAIDNFGNIYVTDNQNGKIRKIAYE